MTKLYVTKKNPLLIAEQGFFGLDFWLIDKPEFKKSLNQGQISISQWQGKLQIPSDIFTDPYLKDGFSQESFSYKLWLLVTDTYRTTEHHANDKSMFSEIIRTYNKALSEYKALNPYIVQDANSSENSTLPSYQQKLQEHASKTVELKGTYWQEWIFETDITLGETSNIGNKALLIKETEARLQSSIAIRNNLFDMDCCKESINELDGFIDGYKADLRHLLKK